MERRCVALAAPGATRCCDARGDGAACTSICTSGQIGFGSGRNYTRAANTCVDTLAATADAAAAECRSHGLRLCTVQEHGRGVCCKTGCGLDSMWVWTADGCASPSVATALAPAAGRAEGSRSSTEFHHGVSAPCPSIVGEPCDLPFVQLGKAVPPASACPLRQDGARSEPPLLAHCITGLVRSFTMPVVYRTIRKHLILSMGGRAATFVNLKMFLQKSNPVC